MVARVIEVTRRGRKGEVGDPGSTAFDAITTTGSATAYTITNTTPELSYADGYGVSVKAHVTNKNSPTANLDTLGAKSIKKLSGRSIVDLSVGDMMVDNFYMLHYSSSEDALLLFGEKVPVSFDTVALLLTSTDLTAPNTAVGDQITGGGLRYTVAFSGGDVTTSGGAILDVEKLHNGNLPAIAFGMSGTGLVINGDDKVFFDALEVNHTGGIVDLGGLTYYVTVEPSKNIYVNGVFSIPKATPVNGVSHDYTYLKPMPEIGFTPPNTSLLRDARSGRSFPAFKYESVTGAQSFTIDEPHHTIYSMHLTGSGASEVSYISAYEAEDLNLIAATGVSNSNDQLGHQGLSVEIQDGSGHKLWGSVRYHATNFPSGHLQAIRFEYAGDVTNLASIEAYTLFDSGFSYTGHSSMPTVSHDQRFLVVTGRKSSRDFYVRVFDLAKLVAGGAGDYSDGYLYEWPIDADILEDDSGGAFTPVQGIACDGSLVYIVSGNATVSSKRIHAYTMDGVRVQKNGNVSVGLAEAQGDGAGTFFEPEGLAIYRPDFNGPPALTMLVISGNSGARSNRLHTLGNDSTKRSGRWTPNTTNKTNATSSAGRSSNYIRVGDIVQISGKIEIDPTALGTVEVEVELPFDTTFSSVVNASGVVSCQTTNDNGIFQANTTNHTIEIRFLATDTAIRNYFFSGSYRVI